MSENQEHGWGVYYLVFNVLILMTVLTVAVSYVDVGELLTHGSEFGHGLLSFLPIVDIGHGANIFVGLLIAMVKGSLVLWFFMHQNHEEGVNRFIFGFSVSLFLLAVLVYSTDFVFLGTYAHDIAGMAMGTN